MSDLRSKAISGSVWAIIENFSLQIVQLVVGIILARILSPKDYGLIALTGIFTGISAAITDGGFEKTLIRKKDLVSIEINTVFFINVFLGFILTIVAFFCSPYVADFFEDQAIIPIFRFVSLGFSVTAFGQVQKILLMKELKFKKISFAQIISSLAGSAVGIVLAYSGFGVWALAWSAFTVQVVRVVVFWLSSDWYPKMEFSYPAIREMIPYGLNILFSSVLLFMLQQYNTFIIGKFYTKSELGLFNRGGRFPDLVILIIQSVVLKLTFPLFAKIQDDKQQLVNTLKKIVGIVSFILFPLLAVLFANADDLTIFLYTNKWAGSIIFLQCLCIVKMFDPFISVQRELILIKGDSKLLLRIFIGVSIFEVLLVFFCAQYGIIYILAATFLSKLSQYIIYLSVTRNKIGVFIFEQVKWLLPYLSIAVLASVAGELIITGLEKIITLKLYVRLFIKVFSIGSLYILSAYLFKLPEISFVNSLCNIFLGKIGKLRYKLYAKQAK